MRTLGKSGWFTEKLKELGKLAEAERKEVGARFNRIREEIQAIEAKRLELDQARVAAKLAKERIDVTLPVAAKLAGACTVTKVRLKNHPPPHDLGPRKAAAADGSRIDTADDPRNGVMFFQRNDAHDASP